MSKDKPTVACKCNQVDPEPCELHDDLDMAQLMTRRMICHLAIKTVKEEGDPNNVLEEYLLQRDNINAAIKKRDWKDGKPPPTTVALKTGSMAGKAQKNGRMQ